MNKVIFLGSKDIGSQTLSYLIKHQDSLNIKIVGVLTNAHVMQSSSSPQVKELAAANKIPLIDDLDALERHPSVDFLISVQYHLILHSQHIAKAKRLAINLHMAPLPEHRGCNQFSFAILQNDAMFGTTIHVLSEGIDAGDVLVEDRFPIPQNIWVKELYELTVAKSKLLFEREIGNILHGNYRRISQLELSKTREQGFQLRSAIDAVKEIQLHWPDSRIDRHIRATYFPPFPGPYVRINGRKYSLTPKWKQEIAELRTK